MKILLTGPTGFIGSAFARCAVEKGHRVAGLIVPAEKPPPDLAQHPGVTWIPGTLSSVPWEQIEAFAPDVCLHTAWITTPGVYLEAPDNISFMSQSLEFLRGVRQRGASHIIGLGTCIEYQISSSLLSEQGTPIAPTTTYARCKNDLRLALEDDAKQHGYSFCWVRIFYPYGPGEHPSRLCSSIIQQLSLNEPVVLKTPESTKDYIYIKDLAAALLTVAEARFTGPINIGTGHGLSVREIARTLGELLGKPQLIQERPGAPDPFGFVVADSTRLRNLGWQPEFDLRAGLRELIASRLKTR